VWVLYRRMLHMVFYTTRKVAAKEEVNDCPSSLSLLTRLQ
jgi:hypothetical protein